MSNNQNQGASIEAERALFEATWRKAYNMPDSVKFSPFVGGRYLATAIGDAFEGWMMARRTPAAQVGAGGLPPPDALVKSSEWNDAKTKRQSFNGWRVNYGDCDMGLYTADSVKRIVAAAIEADRAQPSRQYVPLLAVEYVKGLVDREIAEALGAQPADLNSPEIPVGSKAGAQPDQRESAAVPDGWSIEKDGDTIRVSKRSEGFAALRREADDPRETVLFRYFDQLAASPAAQPAKDEQTKPSPMYFDAVKIVKEARRASVSLVQRRLRISWDAARDMIELMLSRRDVPLEWAPPVYQLNVRQDNANNSADEQKGGAK